MSLYFYHKWRVSGSKAALAICYVSLALSVLSKESGICVLIYMGAYELAFSDERWMRRAANLAGPVVIIVIWRMFYNYLGYGFYGGDMYVDPVRSPLIFLRAVVERWPVMFADLWGVSFTDVYAAMSEAVKTWLVLIAGAFSVFVVVMIWPLLRHSRLARFWLVGLAGSLVISCTAMFGRVLLFASIGGFGLIALFIYGVFAESEWAKRAKAWRVAATTF